MHFDIAIGNPGYQDEVKNKGDRPNPIYDKFMEEAYKIADTVELVTPARFLFNAGQTSKEWNQKMLSDDHFKVLHYEADASKFFSNTDIKGGVAIHIRSASKTFGAIGIFTPYKELNSILRKVVSEELFLDTVVSSRGLYRFSESFYHDYPEVAKKVGKGTGNMIVSNIFDVAGKAFRKAKTKDDDIAILGRKNNTRVIRYIKRKYVIENDYIDKYKVMIAEANGTGQFGETLSSPFVAPPGQGATDTFISIGMLDSETEAQNLLKYIKTKFSRALLGVNKATQHNPKSVWRSIPLQDFTNQSDIDWNASIKNIDRQLYKKYNLSNEEIEFIETHVKEME